MRLVSYNIHKGIGGRDRRYDLGRILGVLEHENPDILCLQEVDRHVRRSRYDDQPRILREHFLAAGSLYQMNVRLRTGGYGNLLLCRWPLAHEHQVSLRLRDKKPRGAQLVVVKTPEGPLHLVNLHLGLADRERHWQIGHLLGHRLFDEGAGNATLIAGDTNDWRNSLSKGTLRLYGFHQATAPPSRFRSFPAWFPLGSLDKAFVRGAIRVVAARVVHTPLARRASDHLPLVVDFHLDPELEAPARVDVRADGKSV
jgi:endonuclease/exonuclease/phosphatase family metal-dependent hydrolase